MNLRQEILNIAGRIVTYARFSKSRRGEGNKWIGAGYVQGPEPDPELGEAQIELPVRLLQWFGFRSAPPTQGTECAVTTSRGGTSNRLCLAADNLTHGPLDLKDGESAVYNAKSGTIVKLDVDGNVTIIPGAGAKVKLGDGDDADIDKVALFTALKSQFDTFVSTYNGHTHVYNNPAGPSAPAPTATPSATSGNLPNSVASSNVYAKKP